MEIYSLWAVDEPILAALVLGGIGLVVVALVLAYRRSGPESRRVIVAIGIGMVGPAVFGALLVTWLSASSPAIRAHPQSRDVALEDEVAVALALASLCLRSELCDRGPIMVGWIFATRASIPAAVC